MERQQIASEQIEKALEGPEQMAAGRPSTP
jgi:hypothetical protein